MVTTASIRSAFHRIALIVCGSPAGLIRVVVPSTQEPRVYVVALSSKAAAGIYAFLSEELDVAIPSGTAALVLTANEAAAVVRLARELAPLDAEVGR